jgi:prolyl 4-hydroxylase
VFPNFIDRERSERIITEASSHLRASQLALRKNDKKESTQDVRTSSGTFMSSSNDPTGVLGWLDDRIAAVTSIPKANFEVRTVLTGNRRAMQLSLGSPWKA